MKTFNLVVTLTGSRQALTADRILCRPLIIQPDEANTHPVYLGGDELTTANGIRLEGQDAATHPPLPLPLPYEKDVYFDLSDIYVIGTADDKVRVMGFRP